MGDEVCKYYPCIVSERTGRNCASPEDCQTRKFYDRYASYPRENEYVGIGAVCDSTVFNKLEQEALKND